MSNAQTRQTLVIWYWLMALVVVSVGASVVLPKAEALMLIFAVAVIKALLVARNYMHLKTRKSDLSTRSPWCRWPSWSFFSSACSPISSTTRRNRKQPKRRARNRRSAARTRGSDRQAASLPSTTPN